MSSEYAHADDREPVSSSSDDSIIDREPGEVSAAPEAEDGHFKIGRAHV